MPRDERARTPSDVPVSEMERLLSMALARGGTFADLYFEHETTSSLFLEEGIIRSASAGVTLRPGGPGGRRRADRLRLHRRPLLAGDGARRRDGGPHRPGLEDASRRSPSRPPPSTGATARRASACCRSPSASPSSSGRTARRAPPTRASRRCSRASGEQTRRVRIASSLGRAGRGRAAAVLDPRERHRERQGRAARGLGRRRRPARAGVLRGEAARALRARSGAHGDRPAGSGRGAGRDDAGGARAGLARHPAARGRRPRPRGGLQPQGAVGLLRPDRRAGGGAGRHGGGRRHDRRPARQPERRRRGQPPRAHRADRGRHPARLPAGPHERLAHEDGPDRQRPA